MTVSSIDTTKLLALSAIEHKLKKKFISQKRDEDLRALINNVFGSTLYPQDVPEDCGSSRPEARCIVVTGESGAGKTRALTQIFQRHPALEGYGSRELTCTLLSSSAPSPCTPLQLGHSILHDLGYPMSRSSKEHMVYAMVRQKLQENNIKILHIDEMQHVTQNANVLEIVKVANTLKDFLINLTYPVGLVISGMPVIRTFFQSDPQLLRRCHFFQLKSMTLDADAGTLDYVIRQYAQDAGLSASFAESDHLVARLIHAARRQFGDALSFVIAAVLVALRQGHQTLGIEDFATVFAERTGNGPLANAFLIPSWSDLDVSVVNQEGPVSAIPKDAPLPPKPRRKSSKKKATEERSF